MTKAGGGVPRGLLDGLYAFDDSSGRNVRIYMVDSVSQNSTALKGTR